MFLKFEILLLFAKLVTTFTVVAAATTTPTIKITLDDEHEVTVLGTANLTWRGEVFYAFRGIRYAKSPVGDLRFKDPQAFTSYPDVIDARYDGHDCPSIYATNSSEDCLILNVYTKQLNCNASLPVIAFIHPGGLYVGSSLSNFMGPEYLLTHELVLVTFNYRLGPLGFLNLGTAEVPGNAGFKDQIMALRWLKTHIQHFGGNPNNVTLMGYSAGALSVSLHLVSPMSRHLFHKAIIMSGAIPPQTILQNEQRDLVARQIKLLKCSQTDKIDDPRDCLAHFTGTEISNTLRDMFIFGKDNPIYLWLPVIEKNFGQERFLTEDYYTMLESGNFNKVPLLVGWTSGEFCTSAADIISDAVLLASFNENFHDLAPKIFMYEKHLNRADITAAIKRHYLNTLYIDHNNFDVLCDLFSDAIIRFGAHRIASFAAKFVSTTMFSFEYSGRYSNLKYSEKERRAEHMDDLMYLFRMEPHHFAADDEEASIVELMTNFFYNFAAYGETKINCTFPASNIVINSTLKCQNAENFRQAKFWNQLFPMTKTNNKDV